MKRRRVVKWAWEIEKRQTIVTICHFVYSLSRLCLHSWHLCVRPSVMPNTISERKSDSQQYQTESDEERKADIHLTTFLSFPSCHFRQLERKAVSLYCLLSGTPTETQTWHARQQNDKAAVAIRKRMKEKSLIDHHQPRQAYIRICLLSLLNGRFLQTWEKTSKSSSLRGKRHSGDRRLLLC